MPRQWAHPSLSHPLPPASSSCLRLLGNKTSRVAGQGGPDSGRQRTPPPDGRPPRRSHPVRLQLFPLAQAAEEGLLLPAQRLPGGQEHRAPHVEPHPLAPAARRAAAHPRRRRCLPGLHPPGSPRRLHPPGAAAGGGQVPRAGHAGSCSPRPRKGGRRGGRSGGAGSPEPASRPPSPTHSALRGRPADPASRRSPLAESRCLGKVSFEVTGTTECATPNPHSSLPCVLHMTVFSLSGLGHQTADNVKKLLLPGFRSIHLYLFSKMHSYCPLCVGVGSRPGSWPTEVL